MSEEREVHDPSTGGSQTMEAAVITDPAEIKRLRSEKKAVIMRVLERGQTVDRLQVPLPNDLYGEWIPDDKQEIHRMQLLGFRVDDKYAVERALHDKGDGRSVVGDTVFMVCERETKEIIDEIRAEQYQAANGKPGKQGKMVQKEEGEFAKLNRTLGIGPVVEESTQREARKGEIQAALNKVNQGTVVAPPGTIIK